MRAIVDHEGARPPVPPVPALAEGMLRIPNDGEQSYTYWDPMQSLAYVIFILSDFTGFQLKWP